MNHLKPVAAAASMLLLLTGASPVISYAENAKTHTVTVLDFDGNTIKTISVNDGAALDLSSVDTGKLEKHIDDYTQIGFSSWSSVPSAITADTTVQALYKKMVLSLDSMPSRTEYYDNYGSIDLSGLAVSITVYTQLPEKDSSGSYKVSVEKVNIESECSASPADLQTAFASSDKADIKIYPISSKRPIASYPISYYPHMGDADMDGYVDSADATFILGAYSSISTGRNFSFGAGQKKRCDIDSNGKIDATDATLVLRFYADASVMEHPCWSDVLK